MHGATYLAKILWLELTGSRYEPTITLLNKHNTTLPFKSVLYLSIYRLMQLSDPIVEVSLCSGWMDGG